MKQEELTEAIAQGIDEGVSRVARSFIKGLWIGIFIIVLIWSVWIIFHATRPVDSVPQAPPLPKNVNGWGNEYICFFDNPNTNCGKTRYCSPHIDVKTCSDLNGTYELETESRFWEQWIYYDILRHNYKIPDNIKNDSSKDEQFSKGDLDQ
jgi:hypothetical protein